MTTEWRTIKTLDSPNENVKVGLWPGEDEIYFTIENLTPGDFVDSDAWEFPVKIDTLEQIIREVRELCR